MSDHGIAARQFRFGPPPYICRLNQVKACFLALIICILNSNANNIVRN